MPSGVYTIEIKFHIMRSCNEFVPSPLISTCLWSINFLLQKHYCQIHTASNCESSRVHVHIKHGFYIHITYIIILIFYSIYIKLYNFLCRTWCMHLVLGNWSAWLGQIVNVLNKFKKGAVNNSLILHGTWFGLYEENKKTVMEE